jgi:hypothetical protein
VFCKEPSDLGLFCATFDLRMSILLYGFNLPPERRVSLLTVVLSDSKPNDAQADNVLPQLEMEEAFIR